MLTLDDILILPGGVSVDERALADEVRGESFALNAAGAVVVACQGRPLGDAAAELRERFGLAREQAERDVLSFAWLLNRALLANIVRPGRPPLALVRFLAVAVRLLPLGIVPPMLNRRQHLDTATAGRVARGTLAAAAPRSLVATVGGLFLSAPLLPGDGGASVGSWLALGAAIGVGVALHELGHALALEGLPAALVTSGLALSILYPRSTRRRVAAISLAGPALPAAIALLLATVALAIGVPLVATIACPLAAHALTVTLAGRDGRTVCRS